MARHFRIPGHHGLLEAVKTIPCNFSLYSEKVATSGSGRSHRGIRATWLGHAGFLVQLPPVAADEPPMRIVFDPIFSERASPSTWFGPRRWIDAPCKANELPTVNFVVISHNHYDHLDIAALKDIYGHSSTIHFLVPLGIKALLLDELPCLSQSQVQELDWWENRRFPSSDGRTTVEFVCTPAQHNSGRGLFDQSHTLWASWVVRQLAGPEENGEHGNRSDELPYSSIYFAGDTGYQTASGPCPVFKEIGGKYGPFDLAMLPIWRGASLSFLGNMGLRLTEEATENLLSTLHASPADAVEIAFDVHARHTLAMHFGTFCGSDDEAVLPLAELNDALKKRHPHLRDKIGPRGCWREEGGFGAIDVGETIFVRCSR
ncbi:Metallo-hydrolase/oxidoreductase [Fistulina hepatica ATCC 64428]|uniref:Metallo-hydrolase/oxidoreductase n=1 Tax=Fistulina hepatica ATCC 64428 TaxID=1128425 RepID=A0A0D7A1H4_9AGAR|nr:Metallo-hydrolase/oxidoreductase [Fistulina hepatica ATCC 64428]